MTTEDDVPSYAADDTNIRLHLDRALKAADITEGQVAKLREAGFKLISTRYSTLGMYRAGVCMVSATAWHAMVDAHP